MNNSNNNSNNNSLSHGMGGNTLLGTSAAPRCRSLVIPIAPFDFTQTLNNLTQPG